MNVPYAWFGPTVAALATLVAILEHGNPGVAVPAAIFAVGAAAITIVEAVRPTEPAAAPDVNPEDEGFGRVRDAFRSELMGRGDLVWILDQIERASADPQLPLRSTEYLTRIAGVSDDEFRRYLAMRLDELEGMT